MGYATVTQVNNILAQSLTSATDPTNTSRGNLLKIGKARDRNLVPQDIVEQYIQWADMEIDSALSQQYKTPFCELADFETVLFVDIDTYNSYVVIEKACPLTAGDTIIITNGNIKERHTIEEVVAEDTFSTVDPIDPAFTSGDRVLRVKFPDPLPNICARLAAANLYDKYLYAQSNPASSGYGNRLRRLARQQIDNILNGRTTLVGYHRVGRVLYDPNIDSQYDVFKGSEGSKDLDMVE